MRWSNADGRPRGRRWARAWAAIMLSGFAALPAGAQSQRGRDGTSNAGRELFTREWDASPTRHGGDGLGPLFNATSCAACHHLGGVGGGGSRGESVSALSAFAGEPSIEEGPLVFHGELADLHPGLRNRSSVVLHQHAVAPKDEKRLQEIGHYRAVQTREGLIALHRSLRNTPALFGAGLIDAIPDAVILAAERRRFDEFPEIQGRASRLRDGRLGRFGWKAQTASLRDFVLEACAGELGLEVAGHHQPSLESWDDYDPSALKPDLDSTESRQLVDYVGSLPRPVFRPATDPQIVANGRLLFDRAGCAACHTPVLGRIDGLFSDLLLHDIGDRIHDYRGCGCSFLSSRPVKTPIVDNPKPWAGPAAAPGEAGPNQWRTAPLWGVATSAPYMHDGRAETLDEAIRFHGGEAAATSARYVAMSPNERQCLLAFLHSLKAPPAPRPAPHAPKLAQGREAPAGLTSVPAR